MSGMRINTLNPHPNTQKPPHLPTPKKLNPPLSICAYIARMKTCSNILRHRLIDTAPIAASIARLCVSVITMLDGGLHRAALEAVSKTRRVVREFCKAELANHQRRLKLEMLSHKHWRRLVLKELGGARALARWFAAMKRCALRREALEKAPKAEPKPSAWRKTPERMAEELRLKAHAQKCAKATVHPRITRDLCRMDSEGQFRLPPLPRLCEPRDADAAWTTPFEICEYNYNAVPVTRLSGYNAPIMIWPAEFEAAEAWDYERWLRERGIAPCKTLNTLTLSSRTSSKAAPMGDQMAGIPPRRLIPHLRPRASCGMTEVSAASSRAQDTAYEENS